MPVSEALRERRRQNAREWNRKHPERVREAQRRYYQRHRDEIVARRRSPEYKARVRLRRQTPEYQAAKKKRLLLVGRPSSSVVSRLVAEQGGLCGNPEKDGRKGCGWPLDGDVHVDHILPVAAGGTNDWMNLQALHALCNQRAGATA